MESVLVFGRISVKRLDSVNSYALNALCDREVGEKFISAG